MCFSTYKKELNLIHIPDTNESLSLKCYKTMGALILVEVVLLLLVLISSSHPGAKKNSFLKG